MDLNTFKALDFFAEEDCLYMSSEESATAAGLSIEEFGTLISSLINEGLLGKNGITEKGLKALEPYRAKRAVFLAAGFGSRMVPITINTPKPLVRVHGKRIIDTILDAVLAAGIEDIYIVNGYLGEQFELLKEKYPMIKLIKNPEYDGTGTISSFYYARDLLEQSYVLESDLVVQNPGVIRKYRYTSGFMGTKMDATEDWFLRADEKGHIEEVGINGAGEGLYKLIGISFWNEEDGKKLAHDIKEAYEGEGGHKLAMSFVPFRVYKDRYDVHVMPAGPDDVVEIDSFRELQEYDENYRV